MVNIVMGLRGGLGGGGLLMVLSVLGWLVELELVAVGVAAGGEALGQHRLAQTNTHNTYTAQWAAHIEGGPRVAEAIANKHGFNLLSQIFPDFYHLEHRKVAKRSLQPDTENHGNLLSEKQVKWAKQQRVRRRRKRDYMTRKDLGLSPDDASHVFLNDPRWPQMWYLNRGSGLDMSVEGAWKEGITGKGIVVTILDDGLEKDHPDLRENYDPLASYDVNSHDENPMPRYDLIDSNRHGTRCAGEVAAVANNSLCSLGIAFGASVGGVRMLDGDVTDAVEAKSLSLNPQHIDIYSASWGPDDDGKTVDGPGELAMRAFIEGVTKGRGGRGSIFVWASGNGGRDHDNCNCDGYTNSIWTLSISSATEKGLVPWYSEACSSTLATTYSSGSNGEKQVVTTDLHHQCTSSHTGTSASAPLAAGICALALEANTQLTWRDMQHIVVATARPANLKADDWTVNGVGRNVSHSFGYGLMDAAAMVKLARSWHTVPDQHKCEVSAPHTDKVIPAKSSVTLQLNVKECAGVNYLEHVQAKISLMTMRRGDIEIQLTSPAGTKTTLLARRPHDFSRTGFRSWPFMSVHTWGEHPIGVWTLEIHNEGKLLATLTDWKQIFYGTETAPGAESETDLPAMKNVELTTMQNRGGGGQQQQRPRQHQQQQQQSSQQQQQQQQQNVLHSSSSAGQWKEVAQLTSDEILRDMSEQSMSGCQISTRSCLECSSGLFMWDGKCEMVCPSGTYQSAGTDGGFACAKCHHSCRTCTGPLATDCKLCHYDGYRHRESAAAGAEVHCYPNSVRVLVDTRRWYMWILIGLAANLILLLSTSFMLYCRQKGCRCKRNSYDKQLPPLAAAQYKLMMNESDFD